MVGIGQHSVFDCLQSHASSNIAVRRDFTVRATLHSACLCVWGDFEQYLALADNYTTISKVFRGTLKRQLLIAFETLPSPPSISDSQLDTICAELKSLAPRPGLISSLQRLKASGFDLWAASNGGASNTQGLYEKAVGEASVSMQDLGLKVFSCDQVQKAKPYPKVYEYVLEKAGLDPTKDEAYFCAAHTWHVAASFAQWADQSGIEQGSCSSQESGLQDGLVVF
jgi:FMN phosphatase YigB (HAD superfamily)